MAEPTVAEATSKAFKSWWTVERRAEYKALCHEFGPARAMQVMWAKDGAREEIRRIMGVES